jgi:hypothetical protein
MNKQHPILLFAILALATTAPFSNAQAQQPSESLFMAFCKTLCIYLQPLQGLLATKMSFRLVVDR